MKLRGMKQPRRPFRNLPYELLHSREVAVVFRSELRDIGVVFSRKLQESLKRSVVRFRAAGQSFQPVVKIHASIIPAGFKAWFATFSQSPSVCRAGRERLTVKRVPIEGLRPEIQIRGYKLFGLADEEVSAGFEVKMQTLEQRNALGAG
jgi:hypothetical protein